MIPIPRFANGDLIPNEELDIYPQTQEVILASLPPEVRAREEAESKRLQRLKNKKLSEPK